MAITLKGAKEQILVQDQPIASGAEGAVHKIIAPSWYRDSHCVKLYFRQHRTREREQKVRFMVAHPPANVMGNAARIVCWPKETVYEANGRLAGFAMPLAFGGSRLLYELCTPKMKSLPPSWSSKYERTAAAGVEARLKLCVNIAAAINQVHLTGNYVLVDLKPQNLLVTSDGKVSVIDMDSIQISNGKSVLFPAQFATPEYVPVEGNIINPSKDLIPRCWDDFSLAVIFYQLLFGLHPYAASFNGSYKDSTTVADSIKNGLFVFGSKKNFVEIRPDLHDNFTRIPMSLQQLFLKAFDDGHAKPNLRPTAGQWGEITFAELRKPVPQWKPMKVPLAKKIAQTVTSVRPPVRAGTTSYQAAVSQVPLRQPTATRTQPTTTPAAAPFPIRALVTVAIVGILLFIAVGLCRQLSYTNRPTSTQSVSYRVATVNAINLNLRSGPGVHYSVVRVLSRGTQVTVLNDAQYADHATWVRVRVDSLEGWVNQEHLQ